MTATVGIHQEGARGVVPVLVGEQAIQDQDLLALGVCVLAE